MLRCGQAATPIAPRFNCTHEALQPLSSVARGSRSLSGNFRECRGKLLNSGPTSTSLSLSLSLSLSRDIRYNRPCSARRARENGTPTGGQEPQRSEVLPRGISCQRHEGAASLSCVIVPWMAFGRTSRVRGLDLVEKKISARVFDGPCCLPFGAVCAASTL